MKKSVDDNDPMVIVDIKIKIDRSLKNLKDIGYIVIPVKLAGEPGTVLPVRPENEIVPIGSLQCFGNIQKIFIKEADKTLPPPEMTMVHDVLPHQLPILKESHFVGFQNKRGVWTGDLNTPGKEGSDKLIIVIRFNIELGAHHQDFPIPGFYDELPSTFCYIEKALTLQGDNTRFIMEIRRICQG